MESGGAQSPWGHGVGSCAPGCGIGAHAGVAVLSDTVSCHLTQVTDARTLPELSHRSREVITSS